MKSKIIKGRNSILGSLLKNILASLIFGLLAVFLLLWLVFEKNSELLIRDGLYGQAEEVAAALKFDREGRASLKMHEPMQTAYDAFFNNLKYRIMDAGGNMLLSSEQGAGPLLPDNVTDPTDAPEYFTINAGDGILHVASFRFVEHGRELIVQTARSDQFSELAKEAIMPAVFETAAVLSLCVFAVFIVAIFLAVRNVTGKIKGISSEAEQIDPENISSRLDQDGAPAELLPLVTAFNSALGRLESAYKAQQRLVANAAHEIKTPLTIIRGQVDLHIKGGLRDQLLADIDTMARGVRQILHLYQAQDARNYSFSVINIRSIAEEVADTFSHHPEVSDKPIRVCGPKSVSLEVDSPSVFAALRNLVDNAIKFTDGNTEIVIRVTRDGFEVRDGGPGLSPYVRKHMFERFWRGDQSTTDGSGLGLSIVAEVAKIHGGEVVAVNAQSGRGAIFKLRLR